jgi:hypothetical protein
VRVTNPLLLRDSDIAFVPCDATAYPGNLDASETVNSILTSQQKPAAVLLYSTTASHCNYTDDRNSDYAYLFTSLDANGARTIDAQLASTNRTGSSHILPNMSFAPTGPSMSDPNGPGTDSPNTGMYLLLR